MDVIMFWSYLEVIGDILCLKLLSLWCHQLWNLEMVEKNFFKNAKLC